MQNYCRQALETQADVPSNLLILLDKSGSMGWRMSNAQSINRMFDGVTDSSGNIYIAQFSRYGVRKIDYTTGKTDTSWGFKWKSWYEWVMSNLLSLQCRCL